MADRPLQTFAGLVEMASAPSKLAPPRFGPFMASRGGLGLTSSPRLASLHPLPALAMRIGIQAKGTGIQAERIATRITAWDEPLLTSPSVPPLRQVQTSPAFATNSFPSLVIVSTPSVQ
jgi:hypothetical protein